jgi:hypothetical protein
MSSSPRWSGRRRRGRAAGPVVAATLGLLACSGPADPGPSGITAEELQQVRDQVDDLEERVDTLEDELADVGPTQPTESAPPGAEGTFFGDPRAFVGREVTVRGEITELLAATDVAGAFRIAGIGGDPVAVVSATPAPDVAEGDVVEVAGTVVEVTRGTFEGDFGIAADAVFEDPGEWLSDAEGEVALAAVSIEVPTLADDE